MAIVLGTLSRASPLPASVVNERYRASLQPLEHIAIRGIVESTVGSEPLRVVEVLVKRRGDHLDLVESMPDEALEPGSVRLATYAHRYLVRENDTLRYSPPHPSRGNDGGLIVDMPPDKAARLRVHQQIGWVLGPAALAFGIVPLQPEQTVGGFINDADELTVASEPEIMEGASVWLLTASRGVNRYELWIDPSSGYLPRKIRIHAEKTPSDDGGRTMDLSVEEIQYQAVDGAMVPIGLAFEATIIYGGVEPTVIEQRGRWIVKSVDVQPDFTTDVEAFHLEVPTGKRSATLVQAPHLSMVYDSRSGEIRPAVNTGLAESIDSVAEGLRTGRIGGVESPAQDPFGTAIWPWLVFAAVIASAGIGGLMWWKHWNGVRA